MYRFIPFIVILLLAPAAAQAEESPIALLYGPEHIIVGGTVLFDGSFSYHEGSTYQIVNYEWLVNGESKSSGGSAKTYEHTFAGTGTYTVVLRVTSNNSQATTDEEQITVSVSAAPGRYYYVTDHLGSVRATVDGSGNIVGYDDYYPFGMQMAKRSGVGDDRTREKFTGHELDIETGLVYAGARYYMPEVGRWMAVDRFAEKEPTLSPYQYAGNNPLTYIDVNGDSIVVAYRPIRAFGVNKLPVYHAFLVHYNEETGDITTIAEATNIQGKLIEGVVSSVEDGDVEVLQTINLPEGVSENEFLEGVFDLVTAYDDQTNYPDAGVSCRNVASPCANSNSFIGNILRRMGVDIEPAGSAPLWSRNALRGDRARNPLNPAEKRQYAVKSIFNQAEWYITKGYYRSLASFP